MQRAPLLVPAVAFIAGIMLDAHGVAAAGFVLAAALVFARRDAALALALGLAAGILHGHPFCVEHEYRTAILTGTVTGDVRIEGGIVEFPIAVDGFATLRASAHEGVHAGERLTVRGRIEPLDEPRNPGEPSQRAIGLDDGIAGTLTVQRVLDRRAPDMHDLRVWMPVLRARASAYVRRALPEPHATVLAGALWGERGTLPHDVRDEFQATGTVHVLVTAGLHLGVIAAVLGGICALLRVPRAAAAFATIPPLFLYAWFSGWHLPSQRAAVMLSVALAARAVGARSISLNTLAIAAIAVALMWPVAVGSVSFALSFSCVAAIVLFAEPIANRLSGTAVPPRIAEALALTCATQIGVWPLTAATFFVVAPYAVVANAVVVPLIALTMTAGLAAIATQGVPALAAIFIRWDTWLLTAILAAVHAAASLPGARLAMFPPPGWSIAAYDVLAAGAAFALRRSLRLAVIIIAAASTLVVAASLPHPPGTLTITLLDVGQGDAIVIRTPHGRTIVIDTGGRLERGPSIDGQSPAERAADRVVLPYLRRARISTVDLLILTHPHGDHAGGFAGIVRDFDVREIYDSGQLYGGRAFQDGVRAAEALHIPIHVARCGDRWMADDVRISIVSPCGSLVADGRNDVNENSIVAMLQYRAFRMLFTGDAGFETESRLLRRGVDVRATVLKVGHHGSAYASSQAFLAAVHPNAAVISAGRHNRFGHPAQSTVTALTTSGSAIFRTDQCGAITIEVATSTRFTTMLDCPFP